MSDVLCVDCDRAVWQCICNPLKVDQTEIGANNPRANCWQAALATVSCLPIHQVIDITDPALEPAWWQHSEIWARSHGFSLAKADRPPRDGLSVVVGSTNRSGQKHAVVYRDGGIWHDPHPSRDGLTDYRYAVILEPLRSEGLSE